MIPRILVIDDEERMCWALERALSHEGYQVSTATRGLQGIEMALETEPSTVILDLKIPDIDGIEVLRKLKSTYPNIPVIMITAHGSIETAIEAMKIGATDYITKPFAEEELLARIQAILNRVNSYYSISMRDELTGAYNRRYLKERMDEEFYRVKRTGRPFSIVVLDIDLFKNINDIYGHYAGDSVLVEFVRFLQSRLRKSDLVARLGGDEFLVLLPDTTSGRAYFLVERLRQALEEIRFHHNKDGIAAENPVTISAGIACCPEHGDSAEILFTLADRALYDAKKSGRNATRIAERVNEGVAYK